MPFDLWSIDRDVPGNLIRMRRYDLDPSQMPKEMIRLSVRLQLTSEIRKLLCYFAFNFPMLNVFAFHE